MAWRKEKLQTFILYKKPEGAVFNIIDIKKKTTSFFLKILVFKNLFDFFYTLKTGCLNIVYTRGLHFFFVWP